MRNQLLCTFAVRESLNLVVDYVQTYYEIARNKIYLYREQQYRDDLFLVYNVYGSTNTKLAQDTISIHRKKPNTLYTINALNHLIMRINNGVLDRSYQIEWENYPNKFLIIRDQQLQVVDIEFEKVINL